MINLLKADLFLYSSESEFLANMIRGGHRKLARSFNLCYRYIHDLIVFNNKKFGDYVKQIYPSQLTVEKANTSDDLANYLDLTFIIESNNRLYTKLYDKRDDFDFHIVNFPFLLSNIPSSPSYGVYIPQLTRYARWCSYYDDLVTVHYSFFPLLIFFKYIAFCTGFNLLISIFLLPYIIMDLPIFVIADWATLLVDICCP